MEFFNGVKVLLLVWLCSVVCHAKAPAAGKQKIGGIKKVTTNSLAVQEAVRFAVSEINKRGDIADTKLELRAILSAKQQLVSGFIHYLKLSLIPTKCKKNDKTTAKCERLDQRIYECTFKVWSQPWAKDEKFKLLQDDFECKQRKEN